MDKVEFTSKMTELKEVMRLPSDFHFNDDTTRELIQKSANASKKYSIDEVWGARNLIIAMEELNELSQQISKFLRGKGDYYSLVEELADVHLVLQYVYTCCDIDEKDVAAALEVKRNALKKCSIMKEHKNKLYNKNSITIRNKKRRESVLNGNTTRNSNIKTKTIRGARQDGSIKNTL